MKRDHDYLRDLLLTIEASGPFLTKKYKAWDISEDDQKYNYHLDLLDDAGYLKKTDDTTFRMTNSGHDFLDTIKDAGIWQQTKSVISETGGSLPLEIFKALATGFLKKKIEKHTGIEL